MTTGVLLHLPMFWMGRGNGFRLADMPMDAEMTWGMVLIVAGICIAGYGLLPKRLAAADGVPHEVAISAPEDAPLGPRHWRLMVVLTVALVIDVMKPASLGFVVPGMIDEYGVPAATIAWLPFAALCGTVVGSVIWGVLADLYGRRASILLSAVMFVGTSICGAMPSLWWNVGMCFLMGAAAGGMLPVTYALLAETMPSRQRGWALVLVGGLGAVGGYLAASGLSAWLQPMFGWRILWFLNLPTGLLLILLNVFVPESPKFLISIGRTAEAHAVLRGFGCTVQDIGVAVARDAQRGAEASLAVLRGYAGTTWALSVAALAWGLINFGLLLWMPAHLVAKGYSMALTERAARRLGADRAADRLRRRVPVQPLEQQGRAAGDRRADGGRPARRDPSRACVAGRRQPGLAGRGADRRRQWPDRDAAAVCRRELSDAGARSRHRLDRGLHQGRRPRRAVPEPARCWCRRWRSPRC